MRKLLSTSGAVALLAALAACSSSDGNTEITASEINSLLERAEADGTTEVTDAADLDGEASMSGIVGVFFEDSDDEIIFGDMNVVANFNDSEMTGKATNLGIYDVTGEEGVIQELVLLQSLEGELDLDATISGVTFAGVLDGEIAGDYEDDDYAGTFVADVELDVVDGGFGQDEDGLLMAGASLEGDAILTVTIGEDEFDETRGLAGELLVSE